jgi:plastocyanin
MRQMIRLKMLAPLTVALAVAALAPLPANAGGDDPEAVKICKEAGERYQELYGDLPAEEGVVIVKMYKYHFCPGRLEIPVGTKVRWINVDKRTSHSVWFKEQGEEESERMFPEEFTEKNFEQAGEFPYICGPHGEREDMRGGVVVTP